MTTSQSIDLQVAIKKGYMVLFNGDRVKNFHKSFGIRVAEIGESLIPIDTMPINYVKVCQVMPLSEFVRTEGEPND